MGAEPAAGGRDGVAEEAGAREPLCRTLVFTAKELREAFEQALSSAGGTLATWVVLNGLSDVGPSSQAALAGHVHLEGATITHHVDRLEQLGLVVRELDPGDRRVRRVRPTAAGTALHARLQAAVGALAEAATAGLGPGDRAALARMLRVVHANLAARAG